MPTSQLGSNTPKGDGCFVFEHLSAIIKSQSKTNAKPDKPCLSHVKGRSSDPESRRVIAPHGKDARRREQNARLGSRESPWSGSLSLIGIRIKLSPDHSGHWCNGNTSLFGGEFVGSNPACPTIRFNNLGRLVALNGRAKGYMPMDFSLLNACNSLTY